MASALVERGHEVRLGARRPDNDVALAWAAAHGPLASAATFAVAAEGADVLVNATAGAHSLDALGTLDHEAVAGAVLLDLANPLEVVHPGLRVVKALNTVNADVMVDPALVPGDHVAFVCGDEVDAKAVVVQLLGELAWPSQRVLDLGPLRSARGTEGYLLLWLAVAQRHSTSAARQTSRTSSP